jgi:hypothetical protein
VALSQINISAPLNNHLLSLQRRLTDAEHYFFLTY